MASNPAYYLGTTGLDLVKAVNAVDPAHPTAAEDANVTPVLAALGSTVTFSYVVTNSGTGAMTVIDLVDDNATPGVTADDVRLSTGAIKDRLAADGIHNVGDTNANGTLDPGERWVYTWAKVVSALGAFTNTATVSAVNTAGQSLTATDIARYTVAGGHVTIKTAVNAAVPLGPTAYEDANTPPGALLAVGSVATFTYRVINDGFTALANVVVTDTHGWAPKPVLAAGFNVGDVNQNGRLDVGEIWLYTSAGATTVTVTAGLYTDVSNVSATPCVGTPLVCSGAPVTSTDPTYLTGAVAGISIVKAVNAANPTSPTVAEDANNPAGPLYVTTGAPVVFTYLVTQTTRTTFVGSSLVIVDDNGTPTDPTDDFSPTYVSGDANGNGLLDRNEVWLYTSSGKGQTTALSGLHGNVVRVTATVGSTVYGAQDLAYYSGLTAGVAVKKATNAVLPLAPTVAEEGDSPATQLYLLAGVPVVWTYRVTNTGTSALQVTSVVDSRGFTAKYVSGDANANGLLDTTEVWLYTSAGVAGAAYSVVAGQFVSSVTVNAKQPNLGTVVTASDVSDHFGAVNSITVVKAVNAVDPLKPTAYEDANYPTGPVLAAGSTVTWTYAVKNTGTTSLDVTSLNDDAGTGDPLLGFVVMPVFLADSSISGDTNKNGLLDPGETWLYLATGTVAARQYANTATVTASVLGEAGVVREVTATDLANYLGTPTVGGAASIQVVKKLNGVHSPISNPALVKAGSAGSWTYAVTAPAGISLANVVLVDDNGTPGITTDDLHPAYVSGDTNLNQRLDPGETWIFAATSTLAYGPITNVVLASAQASIGGSLVSVYDDDINYAFGVTPKITLTKAVNALDPMHPTLAEDANSQPAKELLIGTTATWTYLVTNTGNAPVAYTSLRDDNGTPGNTADDFTPSAVTALFGGVSYNVGDLNHNGLVDVGESWLYRATTNVRAGPYQNSAVAVVTQPTTLETATAGDVAGYFGNASGEGLTPGYWKNHPTAWPVWSNGVPVFDINQPTGTVFTAATGVDATNPLIVEIDGGGGGQRALLRAAIAALLSSMSQYISYPVTARWIIDSVNAAITSGDPAVMTALQNQLDGWNNYEANQTPPSTTPSVSVAAASVLEGNSGTTSLTFTVSLSWAASTTVTVAYATSNGTALAGSDYVAKSGTVTFGPGQTTATVTVTVNGDTVVEPDETLRLTLSAPSGALLGTASAVGTITNDDVAPPTASIAGRTVIGSTTSQTVLVTVTLSAPSASTVTVKYATADGTAKAGTHYVAATGTLTFAPGQTTQTVSVTVLGRKTGSTSLAFSVTLSAASGATLGTSTATVTVTGTTALVAGAGAASVSGPAAPLTTADVVTATHVAIEAWVAAGAPRSAFARVQVSVGGLTGGEVGLTTGTSIVLDRTAAGYGWYVGVDGLAFSGAGADLSAVAGSLAVGRIDLLSVLLHELGHVLGLPHGSTAATGDVMDESILPGQRRLLPAAGWVAVAVPKGAATTVNLAVGTARAASAASTVAPGGTAPRAPQSAALVVATPIGEPETLPTAPVSARDALTTPTSSPSHLGSARSSVASTVAEARRLRRRRTGL